ncbi:MAG: hypothetical protein HKN36_01740 [Hellea sp.]|nr:hypothetical protein [Hellea sp.]
MDLAEAHIENVDIDFEDTPNFLSRKQIVDYHHDVLKKRGYSKTGFGGTPVTGTGIEAWATDMLTGWCNGCD